MLLRQTLLYLPAQIIGPVFQLVSVIVWTHVTDQHALGVITLITATHELLQTTFLAWWSQYALRFLGRFVEQGDSDRFYRTENFVLICSLVVQSATTIIVLLTVIEPGANTALIVASLAYVISRSLNLYIAERARVRGEIFVYSVQQIAGPSLGFLLGLVLIRHFGGSPEWALAGYAVVQTIAALGVLPLISFSRRIFPLDREILDQALHYGIPLIIGGALGWLGLNAARFAVSEMMSVAAAGLFAVGYGLGQRASAVAAMLVTTASFPLAVKRMDEGNPAVAMRQLADNGALLAAILLPSVAGLYALREEIVRLLIAVPFQDATIAILPLSALAGAVRNLRSHFADQVFLLHHQTRLSVLVNGVEAACVVVAAVVCVYLFGVVGAAIASLIACCAAAGLSFALGLSRFCLRLPFAHLARIAVATLAMMVALGWLSNAGTILLLAMDVTIGVAVYGAALSALYLPELIRMRRALPAGGGA